MDTNTTLQQIKDALSKSNSIGIAVGKDPSVDQMAAALSLYLALTDVNKKATVATPSDPLVEVSSLVGINKVQTKLGGDAGDLVVSFPYVEGEIEKVSYTQENGYLNIIVKAGEHGLSFDDQDVKYTRGSGAVDLLFVIGTPRLSDLGDLVSGDHMKDVKIINIDTNPANQGFGDVVLVAQQSSSLSEVVADVLLSLGLRLEQDTAQNLLDGIMDATQNFQASATSALAFEIASLLMKRGAQRRQAHVQQPSQHMPTAPVATHSRAVQQPRADYQEPQPRPQTEEDQFADRRNQVQPSYQEEPQAPATNGRSPQDTAPIDWLSPKVYKGSSNF
jgi:hypothetical protein